jgi:hypothetical protein
MKKISNNDFLLPLRNRRGLEPSEEFKKELWQGLQQSKPKKNKLKYFQFPLLTGIAALLVLLIFSHDFQKSGENEKSNKSVNQSTSYDRKTDKTNDQATNNQETNLMKYQNQKYHVSFEYNKEWKPSSSNPERYEGGDGFFEISGFNGENLTLDDIAQSEANHILKPYGSKPEILNIMINEEEARLIMPSQDQSVEHHNQAEVILKYPDVVNINGNRYSYFVLFADKEHIKEIANTIKFIEN